MQKQKGYIESALLIIVVILAIGSTAFYFIQKSYNPAAANVISQSQQAQIIATPTPTLTRINPTNNSSKTNPSSIVRVSATPLLPATPTTMTPLEIYMQLSTQAASATTFEQLIAILNKYGDKAYLQAQSAMNISSLTVQQKTILVGFLKATLPPPDKIISKQEQINGNNATVLIKATNISGGTSEIVAKFVQESGVWKLNSSMVNP